jgi:hypothetical protein
MKRTLINKAVVALTLFFVSSAFAVPTGPCGDEDCCGQKRAECCEPAPGPFAFAYPKDIGLACPSDFYIYGEFLYFQAEEDGLEYGISYSPCEPLDINAQIPFPVTNGEIQGFSNGSHSWHWNPGFRIGLGFYLNHDAWMLEGAWTNVNVTNHVTTSLNGAGVLIPLWMMDNPLRGGGEPVGSARWKADFNTVDFHLAKPSHVSRYLVVSPHFGIRFAYIDQSYSAQYSGDWNGIDGAEYNASNDFWGIGTRAGFDTEWNLGCNAGLYGNIAASILYGKFDISQTWIGGVDNVPFTNINNMSNDLEEELYTDVTNFDIQVGVFWGAFFCDMRYHVMARLGWEMQYWWDQNRMRRWQNPTSPIYNDTVSRGDFKLNGLVFRLQFDF